MRRRGVALWAAALLSACAQPGPPPGGPPDAEPPVLLTVRPDSQARNVQPGAVAFQFDEVITERPQGAPDLRGIFVISPSRGDPEVSWKRTRVEVRPRGGFRPNTTYTVTLLPGMTDLDGNIDSVGRSIVFSTGPTIAQGRITGVVFDWVGDKAAPQALIEAFSLPDSTRYVTTADSLGSFELANIPPGRFLLRGIIDQNRNRELEPRELFDTVTVTLSNVLHRPLYAFVHDTIGPGISSVAVGDSTTLRVTFDRALDTALVVSPGLFTLRRPDSTAIQIVSALTRREADRIAADSLRAKQVADSLKAAQIADSVRRADSARVNAQIPTRPSGRRPVARDTVEQRDTVLTREPPKPEIAIPSTEVILRTEETLPPNTVLRLRAEGIRGLLGRTRTSDRQFRTPRPDTTRADTAAARRDTVSTRPPRDTVPVRIRFR